MLIFRRLAPALLALSYATSCVYYAAVPDPGAAADGVALDATTSSSGVGASSSSGFQTPPAFAPSFDNDSPPGVRVYATSCPAPDGARVVTDGTYTYASGCMEDARFVAQLPICKNATVKKSVAKISGSVVVSSGGTFAARTGTLLYAVDIDLPCRQEAQANGECSNITSLLRLGLNQGETPANVECFDVSETVCNCQVETLIEMEFGNTAVADGALYGGDVPFWIDELGTMTVTRQAEFPKLYPEAAGYWRLTK